MKKSFILTLLLITSIVKSQENKISQYQSSLLAHYYSFVNADKAQQHFDELFISSAPYTAYEGYLQHLHATRQYRNIINLFITKPNILHKATPTMEFIHAHALESLNRVSLADTKFKDLSQRYPADPEIAYYAIKAHLRAEENQLALKKIKTLFKENPDIKNNHLFYFLKHRIHYQMGQLKRAQKSIRRALKLNPKFDRGWLFSAILHESEGQAKEAIAGYKNYIKLAGPDEFIRQKIDKLKILYKRALESYLSAALQEYKQKNYSKAIELVNLAVDSKNTKEAALILKIEILVAQNSISDLLDLLEMLLVSEPKNELWIKVAYFVYLKIKNKQLEKLLISTARSSQVVKTMLYGLDIALRQDNLQVAKELSQAILNVIKDPRLRAKIFFQLCAIYYKRKDYTQLKKLLENPILETTNYLPLLNLAAYYYAKKGNDLKKAQAYIIKVLEKEPANACYLDTQAVIYLKMGDNKKAKAILASIIKVAPKNPKIVKHYSKVNSKSEHEKNIFNF